MNTDRYLEIKNNPEADTMPLVYHYYTLKVERPMGYVLFIEAFSRWILMRGIHNLGVVVAYVMYKLDIHFKIIQGHP